MSWFVQHHTLPGDNILEAFDTEAQANARAHQLVAGLRYSGVVVFEADIEEEVA